MATASASIYPTGSFIEIDFDIQLNDRFMLLFLLNNLISNDLPLKIALDI